jgi:hypothetical protein
MFGIHHLSEDPRARRLGRQLATRSRRRRGRRAWRVEALEERTLLSTWTVNSLGDTGAGTGQSGDLRYCITQADATTGDNTINFSVTGTITLNSILPPLSNTTGLTDIEGPGPAKMNVIRGNSAQGGFAIFNTNNATTVNLDGLTISGGALSGIRNSGTLTVSNCTIDNNSIPSNDFGDGGGINNTGTLTVSNCTIADNTANVGDGGIANDGGTAAIINSTVANNSGGASVGNGATMTITNSTIANNSGGGIVTGGQFTTLTVTNSTIAYNVGNGAEAIGLAVLNGGTSTLDNTIVALNTNGTGSGAKASDIGLDNGGTVSTSSAHNLIGTGGSGGLVNGINGNQVGVANPGLGTLANNGGPTQTVTLLTGSPAIDMGSNALAVDPSSGQPLAYDQRGPGFPRIVDDNVDIGAFEFQTGFFLVVTVQPPGSVTAGAGFGFTVTAEDQSGHLDSSFNGTVTVALFNNQQRSRSHPGRRLSEDAA